VSDLRDRAPAIALMEKVTALRGTPELTQLPFGMVFASADAMNWIRGIRGELEMAAELDRLGDGWTVLHSVLVGDRGSDIDHIVMGPKGIFSINTKRLRDREVTVKGEYFRVDGHKRDYLRNSDYEATRIEKVLRSEGIPVNVMPVIAISGAKSLRVRSNPTYRSRSIGVVVVKGVLRRIRKQPNRLTPQQVERVVAVVTDSSHWTRPRSTSTAAEIQAAYTHISRGITRYIIMLVVCLLLLTGLASGFIAAWITNVVF